MKRRNPTLDLNKTHEHTPKLPLDNNTQKANNHQL